MPKTKIDRILFSRTFHTREFLKDQLSQKTWEGVVQSVPAHNASWWLVTMVDAICMSEGKDYGLEVGIINLQVRV